MDDAVAVLREAVRRSNEGPQTGADVRLALKALRYFWQACQADNDIGRSQSMNAALNRIELIKAGKLGQDR